LVLIASYDKVEECVEYLESLKIDTKEEYKYKKGTYLIIPTFQI